MTCFVKEMLFSSLFGIQEMSPSLFPNVLKIGDYHSQTNCEIQRGKTLEPRILGFRLHEQHL